MDPETFIEQLTAPSFKDESSHFDLLKITERKSSKNIIESTQEEPHDFYVPETPKPNHLKKTFLSSSVETGQ